MTVLINKSVHQVNNEHFEGRHCTERRQKRFTAHHPFVIFEPCRWGRFRGIAAKFVVLGLQLLITVEQQKPKSQRAQSERVGTEHEKVWLTNEGNDAVRHVDRGQKKKHVHDHLTQLQNVMHNIFNSSFDVRP